MHEAEPLEFFQALVPFAAAAEVTPRRILHREEVGDRGGEPAACGDEPGDDPAIEPREPQRLDPVVEERLPGQRAGAQFTFRLSWVMRALK